MTINFNQILDKSHQSSLANEIVTAAAAVASDASAPDFAVRALEQSRQKTLAPEQYAAATAVQAYGSRCAAEIFTPALDKSAADRANEFSMALENECPDDALELLDNDPDAGAEFKASMCRAIAAKCAELVAAEIDRQKKGRITILDENDRQVFDSQHEDRQKKRTDAIVGFLSTLPVRYPSFGASLFGSIRADIQRDVEEKYKSPEIHAAIAAMFTNALAAMQPEFRKQIQRTSLH
jgi:hypothetical protein